MIKAGGGGWPERRVRSNAAAMKAKRAAKRAVVFDARADRMDAASERLKTRIEKNEQLAKDGLAEIGKAKPDMKIVKGAEQWLSQQIADAQIIVVETAKNRKILSKLPYSPRKPSTARTISEVEMEAKEIIKLYGGCLELIKAGKQAKGLK